jgi:lipopolysaccharide export system permease protein
MIKLLDRQMIRGYFQAYAICLASLLTLYIVVDLFTNLDDFTGRGRPFGEVLRHIGSYYFVKMFQIFDRLCEAIALMAAVFTMTWMQRNNEQMPYLSAGVSTHRIVTPVLLCSCFMILLSIVNQEWVLPHFAERLMYEKDDPAGEKELNVMRGAYEPNGVHVEGGRATRKGMMVKDLRVTIPPELAGNLVHITAQEAHYIPDGPRRGHWEMVGTELVGKPGEEPEPIDNLLDVVDTRRCLLHTRDADFDTLTRDPSRWFQYASTARLYEELQRPESPRQPSVAVLFHVRLTRPLLGILLVFLGLSLVLRDQNRNLVLSAGSCLVLCATFFVLTYVCKTLGENEYLSPPLAACLPIIFFGPFGWVLFDAIHT